MKIEKYIKEIETLLNKEKIIKFKLLQISFDIACVKFETSNNYKFIAKFDIKKNKSFNAIESEAQNLCYLNKKFSFFPKLLKSNKHILIMEYIENNNDYPRKTNYDLIESIIKIHSISNNSFGFNFNTQLGAIEQINDFESNWAKFFVNKRLNPIFELANKKENMGTNINEKINKLIFNIENFIPKNILPRLLHGDLWEGNILFNKKKFVSFIDPGSFFGHNEMEVAYLRWFNPPFIDSLFIKKYSKYINLDKAYYSYEPVYQLFYALCNVALWDRSYIKEVKIILKKLKL